jgi:hypothetical protein
LGERSVYKILVRKPEGKRSLGRTRQRWKDIRMKLVRSCGLDASGPGQGAWQALVNTIS